MNKFLIFVALIIILILGSLYIFLSPSTVVPVVVVPAVVDQSPKVTGVASFICNEGKTIAASFYEKTATATPSTPQVEPPVPQGGVNILLSDTRTFDLPQTISADGTRYANQGDAFVFWNKGNGVLILENGVEANYKGCVLIAPSDVEAKLSVPYADQGGTFSIRLPSVYSSSSDGFTIDPNFKRQINPKVTIQGVRFTIPGAMATGTNLSRDSYIAVEQIPNTTTCTAALFLDNVVSTSSVVTADTTYSVATSSEAAAGNRYEETIYALSGSNPCIAIHYFVHYGVFENYPVGSIKEFDAGKLRATFDSILSTLVVNQ